MSIAVWIIFGMIIGIIANLIDPNKERGGFLGAVVLGVLGAILGGILGNIVFGVSIYRFDILNYGLAIVGALGILWLTRAFRSKY